MLSKKKVILGVLSLAIILAVSPSLIGYADNAPVAEPPTQNSLNGVFYSVAANSTGSGAIVDYGGLTQLGTVTNSSASNGGAVAVKDNNGLYLITENATTDALKLTPGGIEQAHYSGIPMAPDPPVTIRDNQGFLVGSGFGVGPNGNIFSGSVSDTNSTKINDSYGLKIDGVSKGLEVTVTGSGTAGWFSTSGDTGISSSSTGAASTGGSFSGTSIGAYGNGNGSSGIGVSATGVSKGIVGVATGASGLGGSFYADAAGATALYASSAGGSAGYFAQGTGYIVNLGTPTAAINAVGIIKNEGLTIGATGDLSDTSGPVFVSDPDGLKSNNVIFTTDGTHTASLTPDGNVRSDSDMNVEGYINNPIGDVKIEDNLYISPASLPNPPHYIHNNGNGVNVNDAKGLTVTSSVSKTGVILKDDSSGGGIQVTSDAMSVINSAAGGITVNSPSYGLTMKSNSSNDNGFRSYDKNANPTSYIHAQNGSVWFKGQMKSDAGFGSYATRRYSEIISFSPLVIQNGHNMAGSSIWSLSLPCSSPQVAVGCGFDTDENLSDVRPYEMHTDGSVCTLKFINNTASPTLVNGRVTCLDPSN